MKLKIGSKLRIVDRGIFSIKVKVGDIVIVTAVQHYDEYSRYTIESKSWPGEQTFSLPGHKDYIELVEPDKQKIEPEFDIGDVVRIRSDLKAHKFYDEINTTFAMEECKGKTARIEERVRGNKYKLDIDSNKHIWSKDMFSLEEKFKFKVGQKVKVETSDNNELESGTYAIAKISKNQCPTICFDCKTDSRIIDLETDDKAGFSSLCFAKNIEIIEESAEEPEEKFIEPVEEKPKPVEFPIGTHIRIKEELPKDSTVRKVDFKGKVAKIKDVHEGAEYPYTIIVEKEKSTSGYVWKAEEFDVITEEEYNRELSKEESKQMNGTKYSIGDKVKIREDLEEGVIYRNQDGSTNSATTEMTELKGQIVTIEDVYSQGYKIDGGTDPWGYTWTDKMFEGKAHVDSAMNEPIKKGDYVKIVKPKESLEHFVASGDICEVTRTHGCTKSCSSCSFTDNDFKGINLKSIRNGRTFASCKSALERATSEDAARFNVEIYSERDIKSNKLKHGDYVVVLEPGYRHEGNLDKGAICKVINPRKCGAVGSPCKGCLHLEDKYRGVIIENADGRSFVSCGTLLRMATRDEVLSGQKIVRDVSSVSLSINPCREYIPRSGLTSSTIIARPTQSIISPVSPYEAKYVPPREGKSWDDLKPLPKIKLKEEKREGNKIMKKLFGNQPIGKIEDSRFALSVNGVALYRAMESGERKYVTYDAENKKVTDVDNFVFGENEGLFFALPVQREEVSVGDVILYDRAAYFVSEIAKDKIVVLNPANDKEEIIRPRKNMFGFNFFTKIISPFNNMGENSDNPMAAMLPFMMMGEGKDTDMKDIMMLSMLSGKDNPFGNMFGGSGSGQFNPMMLMLMNKDGKSDIFETMMMMQMFQGMAPKTEKE